MIKVVPMLISLALAGGVTVATTVAMPPKTNVASNATIQETSTQTMQSGVSVGSQNSSDVSLDGFVSIIH